MSQGSTLNEHLIAVAFGVAGMAIYFSFFMATRRIYEKTWVKMIFNLMIIGDLIKAIPLAIPIGIYTAIVLCSGIASSGDSLWSLLTIVGVITGASIAQLHLTTIKGTED